VAFLGSEGTNFILREQYIILHNPTKDESPALMINCGSAKAGNGCMPLGIGQPWEAYE
jgi:hypothetical protein